MLNVLQKIAWIDEGYCVFISASLFATAERVSFSGKYTAKIGLQLGHIMLPTDIDIGSLKSLHTVF